MSVFDRSTTAYEQLRSLQLWLFVVDCTALKYLPMRNTCMLKKELVRPNTFVSVTTTAVQATGPECRSGLHSICGPLWTLACTYLTLSTIEMLVSMILTCGGKFMAGGTANLNR